MWHIKLYNTRETRRAAGIWKICCWIHVLAWISHSCIVIHKLLVLDGSLHYVQCVPSAVILHIFYCLAWFDTVKFNCLPSANNEMCDDAVFADRFQCQYAMFECRVLIGYLDSVMLILLWNRFFQNHRSILPNFLSFAWLDTFEFNRLPY